jgi:hypothetical protein
MWSSCAFQLWHTARSAAEVASSHGLTLTGSEAGLAAYWQFNEGRGAVTASRLGGRLPTFGALRAAYMDVEAAISDSWFWAPSGAPVGDVLSARQDRPLLLTLNGSDARLRPLLAELTALPAAGALLELPPEGDGPLDLMGLVIGGAGSRVEVGDRVPVGLPSLVYVQWSEGEGPDAEAQPPVDVELRFVAVTPNGERSPSEGVVRVVMAPVPHAPSMELMDGVFAVKDLRVEDVDVGEDDGEMRVSIAVDPNRTSTPSYVSLPR